MILNGATLHAIFVNLRTEFNRAFEATASQWQEVAMRVPSTGSQNDYKWMGDFPKMRKWIGDKAVGKLSAFTYTIVNDDWEVTIEVDRNDIEDDNLGIYAPQAQMAGASARELPDEIVFELLDKGFINACYDGQYFFDTDHPVGNASVSNKGTVALSVASQAAAQASLGAARIALRKMKSDLGRSLNIRPNLLVVPPALEDVANALMVNERLEDGKANLYRNTLKVLVEPRLTSDTAWYLLDTTKPVKPLIYQERKAPVPVSQTNPEADDVFMRKKYKYGAEARAAGGYGFWQLAFGSTGTT